MGNLKKAMSIHAKLHANIYDLHQAIQQGQEDRVRHIVESGLVNLNSAIRGTTALSLTLYRGRYDLFSVLLQYHHNGVGLFDLNKSSKDEKQRIETPLITAVRLNCYSIAEALVKSNVNLDEVDNYQHTALWVTTRERSLDTVKLLVENGASINPSMKWNQSPLYYAIDRASKRTEIAKYLIQNGALPAAIDQSKKLEPQIILVLGANHDISFCCVLIEAGCTMSLPQIKEHQEHLNQSKCGPNLVKILQQEACSAAPLQRLCRTTVREIVSIACEGRHFIQEIHKLPLPPAVIDSVLLKDSLP